jgi:hypothetical protein
MMAVKQLLLSGKFFLCISHTEQAYRFSIYTYDHNIAECVHATDWVSVVNGDGVKGEST